MIEDYMLQTMKHKKTKRFVIYIMIHTIIILLVLTLFLTMVFTFTNVRMDVYGDEQVLGNVLTNDRSIYVDTRRLHRHIKNINESDGIFKKDIPPQTSTLNPTNDVSILTTLPDDKYVHKNVLEVESGERIVVTTLNYRMTDNENDITKMGITELVDISPRTRILDLQSTFSSTLLRILTTPSSARTTFNDESNYGESTTVKTFNLEKSELNSFNQESTENLNISDKWKVRDGASDQMTEISESVEASNYDNEDIPLTHEHDTDDEKQETFEKLENKSLKENSQSSGETLIITLTNTEIDRTQNSKLLSILLQTTIDPNYSNEETKFTPQFISTTCEAAPYTSTATPATTKLDPKFIENHSESKNSPESIELFLSSEWKSSEKEVVPYETPTQFANELMHIMSFRKPNTMKRAVKVSPSKTVLSADDDNKNKNVLVDKLKNETSEERADRLNRTMQGFMQFFNIIGKVDTYISGKVKSTVKKMAYMYDLDEEDKNVGKKGGIFT